jgi:SAM-dependent methyltransferase
VDPADVSFTVPKGLDEWRDAMREALAELARLLRPGGHVAFEVGEVRGGRVRLEEAVLPAGAAAGLEPVLVLVNDQEFTKTAHCWGVDNNRRGTNTNRVVLFRRRQRRPGRTPPLNGQAGR